MHVLLKYSWILTSEENILQKFPKFKKFTSSVWGGCFHLGTQSEVSPFFSLESFPKDEFPEPQQEIEAGFINRDIGDFLNKWLNILYFESLDKLVWAELTVAKMARLFS